MNKLRTITLLTLAGLLSACGGGGGGAGIPDVSAPIGITSANAESVAKAVFSGDTSGSMSTAVKSSVFASYSTDAAQSRFGQQQLITAIVNDVKADLGIDGAKATTGGSYQALQDVSAQLCSSGSASGTSSGFQQQTYPISGTISMSFANCVAVEDGTTTMNGGLSVDMTINADFSIQMTMSYDSFSTATTGQPTIAMDGSLTASMSNIDGADIMSITSPYFEARIGEQWNRSFDYSYQVAIMPFTFEAFAINGTFDSSTQGGSVTLQTTTEFQIYYPDAYPSTGAMVITGAANSKVRVTALSSTQVTIEVDEDGDGVYDAPITRNWTDIS